METFRIVIYAMAAGAIAGIGLSLGLNEPLSFVGHAITAMILAFLFAPVGLVMAVISWKMRP